MTDEPDTFWPRFVSWLGWSIALLIAVLALTATPGNPPHKACITQGPIAVPEDQRPFIDCP